MQTSIKHKGRSFIFTLLTKQNIKVLFTFLFTSFYHITTLAEDIASTCKDELSISNQQVIFLPQPIFDETEDDTYFFHRWANWLHITTKIKTLENETAFFLQECKRSDDDIAELERHLRSKKYLKDAEVSKDENKNQIQVKTWDNWSLLPTGSFSREGGKNTYSLGVKERNLLGLGIYTKLEAYNNTQRSGYLVRSTIPLFLKNNIELNLLYANNDDGNQKYLFLNKKFVSFHTKYAYSVGFNEALRNDTIFQNGFDQSTFKHEISFKKISYSWLHLNDSKQALRYSVGITQNNHLFSALVPPVENVLSDQLPEDREFLYPWVGLNYVEKSFQELTNIHLITQIEDFNTGWQVNALIGAGNGNKENAAQFIWQANIKKGFSFNKNSLLLLNLNFAGDVYKDKNIRVFTSLTSEYFYSISEQWRWYLNNVSTISKNQYLDAPITIGGDTGLRGFPLQYQHGENSIKFTSEIRYYPRINIFKLFDLAGAVFIDTGKAFGYSNVKNIEDGWLYSAGLGARFYSPHSSKSHQMIHVDLAFPISDNADINRMEIRLKVKQSF